MMDKDWVNYMEEQKMQVWFAFIVGLLIFFF